VRAAIDLAAYDKNGQLALVVETKSRLHTSPGWATRMRRNLLAHGIMPKSEYFMLAMPDNLYLWRETRADGEIGGPDFVIDAEPLFKRYLDAAIVDTATLSEKSLEILVGSWIRDLMARGIPEDCPEPQRGMLASSGLIEAIKGGYVAPDEFT
jgi:hypothetical protein